MGFRNIERQETMLGRPNPGDDNPANALPEGLRQGWINFNQWAAAREKAGSPLPPGGVFILDKFAVLIG